MATASIADLVQRLVPGAQYRRSATYAELEATWTDATEIPTELELEAVRAAVEADLDAVEAEPTFQEILVAILNSTTLLADNSLNALRASIQAASEARDRLRNGDV